MKRKHVDEILSLLDNAQQQSTEHGYSDDIPSKCWRCLGAPGKGSSGVCDDCRAMLLEEQPVPPPVQRQCLPSLPDERLRAIEATTRQLEPWPPLPGCWLDGEMPHYFDRRGESLRLHEWATLYENFEYRVVAQTNVDDAHISTVWMGMNLSIHDGLPLIFETMIFGGAHDEEQYRASTEEQARNAHEFACRLARGEPWEYIEHERGNDE